MENLNDTDKTSENAEKELRISDVMQQREQLINFFKWINREESLHYTEKGINFYVDEYLKIN